MNWNREAKGRGGSSEREFHCLARSGDEIEIPVKENFICFVVQKLT